MVNDFSAGGYQLSHFLSEHDGGGEMFGALGFHATMLHLMTGLNGLFATDSALLGELRAFGMRLFNQSGPIREHAVKVALGVGRR